MTQTYTPPAPVTSATWRSLRLGLIAGWLIFTLGAVGFVAVLGTNAPYADEWEFVPALFGEEPLPAWLWKQHNEHRLPLPRAIYFALFKLTHDFRAGMLAQVALLSALALGLMRLADRLRGRPHWADLFFPISLLHIGHWENFVMGYQLCFALFCVLATGLVVTAIRTTRENTFRMGVTAGVLLMLLALTGGSGLAVIVPVSAWLVYLAVCVWRAGTRGRGLILLLFAVLPLLYLGAYFVDYHKPEHHPEPGSDLIGTVRVACEVLGISFGMGLAGVWFVVCPVLLAVGAATIVLLVRRSKDQPAEWPAVVGLIAVAAGIAGVAVAIGIGRGAWGRDSGLLQGMGLWSRYSLLVWPLLAATYLVWVKFGPRDSQPVAPGAGLHGRSKWVPIALCVVAALAFPGNTLTGMANGAKVKSEYSAVEADNAAGLRPELMVRAEESRYERAPPHAKPAIVLQRVGDRTVRGISLLRTAKIGIFAR
jgi:hypothetical protein